MNHLISTPPRVVWLFVFIFLTSTFIQAQTDCVDGETEITIVIIPDAWADEISWDLSVGGEQIADGGDGEFVLCVEMEDEFPCFNFQIHDSFGDGINELGGYWVYLDGVEVWSGGNYSFGDQVLFDLIKGYNLEPRYYQNDPA